MSDKRSKKNTTKNNKKASKNRKIPVLRLDNDVGISAKTTYTKDTECFRNNDINIGKVRVSELYKREYNSYKYYVFYEHDDEYVPLKIILKNVVGYYNDYKDKIYDIFEHIEKKNWF